MAETDPEEIRAARQQDRQAARTVSPPPHGLPVTWVHAQFSAPIRPGLARLDTGMPQEGYSHLGITV